MGATTPFDFVTPGVSRHTMAALVLPGCAGPRATLDPDVSGTSKVETGITSSGHLRTKERRSCCAPVLCGRTV